MNKETIEKATKNAVQARCQCNWEYPCEGRDYCEFCNGHNSAFDCDENCDADAFSEGFIAGAQWRINSVWHEASEVIPDAYRIVIVVNRIKGITVNSLPNGAKCPKHWIRWAYMDDLLPNRKEDEQ